MFGPDIVRVWCVVCGVWYTTVATHTTELNKQTADSIITFYFSTAAPSQTDINNVILGKTLIAHLIQALNSLKEMLDIARHIKIK